MAISTVDWPLTGLEGETASLTTTASYLLFKPGFNGVQLYSGSAWRMALAPALKHCLYYLASAGTYTEYAPLATDRNVATHVPLDGMVATDYLYLGFNEPALGIYINVDASNLNAVTATLDVEYSSTAVAPGVAVAFTDVAGDSDGTDSGGVTLAQDGVYTWTLPTAWVETTLGTYGATKFSRCYWIRFKPSATLSAAIDLIDIIPVYQNANYGYLEASTTYVFQLNRSYNSALTLKGSTTQTLDVTWLKH